MSEPPVVLPDCPGSGRPPGESFPGMAPRWECVDCGDMLHLDAGVRPVLPVHEPITAERRTSIAAAKANMLFIVFQQGDNWARVAPVVHTDLIEARADMRLRADSYMHGLKRGVVARMAVGK